MHLQWTRKKIMWEKEEVMNDSGDGVIGNERLVKEVEQNIHLEQD